MNNFLVVRCILFRATQQFSLQLVSQAKRPCRNMQRPPKIYTKTGDRGTTSLFTGERRSKDDEAFEALGATDELTSHIGLVREFALEAGHNFDEKLIDIQCRLQDIGTCIATPLSSARDSHLKRAPFSAEHASTLEKWIDDYTDQLPPLRNFILPSGGKTSASLHVARTIARRAERRVVPLVRANEMASEPAIYLNRLSDFLFTLARFAAARENRPETIYRAASASTARSTGGDAGATATAANGGRSPTQDDAHT